MFFYDEVRAGCPKLALFKIDAYPGEKQSRGNKPIINPVLEENFK